MVLYVYALRHNTQTISCCEMMQHVWKPLFLYRSKLNDEGSVRPVEKANTGAVILSALYMHSGHSSKPGCSRSLVDSYFVALSFMIYSQAATFVWKNFSFFNLKHECCLT